MGKTVIDLSGVSKQYRLGEVGTGTLKDDLNRLWARIRGKEDPTRKIDQRNRLDQVGGDYVWALKDVNFSVDEGTVLGVVGKNGAGKSTLLKVLSRITGPTTGEIKVRGRIGSLLEVGTGFHPELSGKDNVYLNGAILGMRKKEIDRKFEEIVEFSGVRKYIGTPVKRYSSGMYVRLAFAVAAHLDAEILVVDEVLAVGDAEFQNKALGKMKDVSVSGRTVLFVSHNLSAVEQLCNRAVLIHNGSLAANGSVGEILSIYRSTAFERRAVAVDAGGRVAILDVVMTDAEGARVEEVELGESIKITVDVKFHEDLKYTDLAVDFISESNEFIAQVTNADDAFGIVERKAGECISVAVTVKSVFLAPGTYFLSVWLGTGYEDYQYLEHCLRLEVRQGRSFISRDRPLDKRAKVVMQSSWSFA